MPTPQDVYETHFGWTGRSTRKAVTNAVGALTGLVAIAIGVLVRGAAGLVLVTLGVLALLTAGASLAVTAAAVRGRRTALRVDREGILLGGHPLRYEGTSALVPWGDIVGVELWVRRTGAMSYVGLHRIEGAPDLPATTTNPKTLQAAERAAGRPIALVTASRPIHLWELDVRQLLNTIARYAPQAVITVDPAFPGGA
ncbi:hypothetical protein GCM10010495_17900 [Kitasatospora herbaricolor]|uniref:hypothetical protein n=1 Tax=Kitasatospora herbaricolor TaxID=68217 RepID=UPI00174DA9B4|nr:hypothetical protein [Kitasatospora herbaricolor]MDQ0308238.1 hypothetical protein [Kitasatospora herbaricolor]GGV06218.1 hypothetical protein GCM10010495_17900 [Kitasatospora herbaricolor]